MDIARDNSDGMEHGRGCHEDYLEGILNDLGDDLRNRLEMIPSDSDYDYGEDGEDSRLQQDYEKYSKELDEFEDEDAGMLEPTESRPIELSKEELKYLNLVDDDELNSFQASIDEMKQLMISLDIDQRKMQLEKLQMENDTESKDPTPRENENHSARSSLLEAKAERLRTIQEMYNDESDEDFEEIIKTVDELKIVEDVETNEDDITVESEKKVATGYSKKEKEILQEITRQESQMQMQIQKAQLERKERSLLLAEEKRRRKEELLDLQRKREQEEIERKERLEREKAERERLQYIWNLQREEEIMRDFIFEEKRKAEEEMIRLKAEEERRRREYEEQQRIALEMRLQAEEKRRKEMEEQRKRELARREEEERLRRLEEEKIRQREEEERKRRMEEEERIRKRRNLEMAVQKQRELLAEKERRRMEERQKSRSLALKLFNSILKSFKPSQTQKSKQFSDVLKRLNVWKLENGKKNYITPPVEPKLSYNLLEYDTKLQDSQQLNDEVIESIHSEDLSNSTINVNLSVEDIHNIHRNVVCKLKITSLILDENQLETLGNIDQFKNLVFLSCNLNRLCDVRSVHGLNGLHELSLHTNRLKNLEGLEMCKALTILNAQQNQLSNIDSLKYCSKLQDLKLYRNSIGSNLTALKYLSDLLSLDLGRNQISALSDPAVFNSSKLLQNLILYQNELEEFPKLDNILLRTLYLNGNRISSMTHEPFHPLLKILNLSDNKELSKLKNLSGCLSLKNLQLQFNNISDLDDLFEALRGCNSIEILQVNDNPIASHPAYRSLLIGLLPKLKRLDSEDVTDEERDAVHWYLASHIGKDVVLNHLKHRLLKGKPVSSIFSTHDINFFEHKESSERKAYQYLAKRQDIEYRTMKYQYQRYLYIPLHKKHNQSKYMMTLQLKKEFHQKWMKLSKKHYEEHQNFDSSKLQNVVYRNEDYIREKSALIIQRAMRKAFSKKKTIAATKIQTMYRGFICRKKMLPWMVKQIYSRIRAAIRIQSFWKGQRIRNAYLRILEEQKEDEELLPGVDIDEFLGDTNIPEDEYQLDVEIPDQRVYEPVKHYRREPLMEVQRTDAVRNQIRAAYQKELLNKETNGERPLVSPESHPSSQENHDLPSSVYASEFHSSYMKKKKIEQFVTLPNIHSRESTPDEHSNPSPDEHPEIVPEPKSKKLKKEKEPKKLQKDQESWGFKSESTANAWEKWSKKRRGFKTAKKKRAQLKDPTFRYKKFKKATGQPFDESMWKRRTSHSFEANHPIEQDQISELEIESISSTNSQRRPKQAIVSQTLNFPQIKR